MDIYDSVKNAIKINSSTVKDVEREIHTILNQKFGKDDGDYFIHTEQVFESFALKKKFKVILIEDKFGKKQQMWFELA